MLLQRRVVDTRNPEITAKKSKSCMRLLVVDFETPFGYEMHHLLGTNPYGVAKSSAEVYT